MSTILVTGGTGSLGRPTADLLNSAGHDVRVLSRTPGDGRVPGNLTTGAGLADALAGIETVLHLATTAGRKDVAQTRNLVESARSADVTHLVYISIVGVDANPYPYYRAKLACERIIEESGIPFTILRATQFHSFVTGFLKSQRRLPFIFSLDVPDQPISVDETAQRLVELVASAPAGRVADIGGPEQLPVRSLVNTWQAARGTHKPVWTLPLFGKTIHAFKNGNHMT
ncbi:MAG: NAD(P)H-binding protein, partial [Rhodoglobus sp.]|nr:NAD(P)H-binding protein [Rhodoglobus sp.]